MTLRKFSSRNLFIFAIVCVYFIFTTFTYLNKIHLTSHVSEFKPLAPTFGTEATDDSEAAAARSAWEREYNREEMEESEREHSGDSHSDDVHPDPRSHRHHEELKAIESEQAFGDVILEGHRNERGEFVDHADVFIRELGEVDPTTMDSCEKRFGLGLLNRWTDNLQDFCNGGKTRLRCSSIVQELLPPPTAPHAFCEAENLYLDFSKTHDAPCCVHRPGYFCGEPTYLNYDQGAFFGQCQKTPDFDINKMPRDHLMDIFDSFVGKDAVELESDIVVEETPTLFITRERGEHANLFHSMTDIVNAFKGVYLGGLSQENMQVVLLDNHPPGPFDVVWQRVYSPHFPVRRNGDFGGKTVLFKKAVFVPPGYSSVLFSNLLTEIEGVPCRDGGGLAMFEAFRGFFLSSFNVSYRHKSDHADDDVHITLVVRRPYNKFVEHSFMSRKLGNEQELIGILESLPNTVVRTVDYAQLTWEEQLQVDSETDFLIGVHGAGDSHVLFLPPTGAFLELFPGPGGWRCFQHMAEFAGVEYRKWENMHEENYVENDQGSTLIVHEDEFREIVTKMVETTRARKLRMQRT